jgi:hypothetical protein
MRGTIVNRIGDARGRCIVAGIQQAAARRVDSRARA